MTATDINNEKSTTEILGTTIDHPQLKLSKDNKSSINSTSVEKVLGSDSFHGKLLQGSNLTQIFTFLPDKIIMGSMVRMANTLRIRLRIAAYRWETGPPSSSSLLADFSIFLKHKSIDELSLKRNVVMPNV
jgi:hypothetical protein